ncbi:MAG TPA: arginase family protein [Candidatus Acidoferrales bacterium]
MAAKIVRQASKIAVLGAPTSAAAMSLGNEGAPAALRAAGLVEQLIESGYQVSDIGDDAPQLYQPDNESPRAKNVPRVLAALEALKPRVEQAVKSAALPLILSGDCSVALATVAGVRRYFRHVGMIYVDRDADANTPATTLTGCVDGMVVSHLTGRGAAELVRFWPEPPLIRDPDLALFGVARLDPAEEEFLRTALLRRYLAEDVRRIGPEAAAETAVERVHGKTNEFVLHFDVDIIAGFEATNYSGADGLNVEEVRRALEVFAAQPHLAAIEVTGYNPAKDSDARGAKLIVELVAGVLAKRLAALTSPQAAESVNAPAQRVSATTADEAETPAVAPGESWSSDDLVSPEGSADNPTDDEPNAETSEPHSSETEERKSR